MHVYYRISDKSYDKPKLPGIGKLECFQNCETVFGSVPCSFEVFADRCSPSTMTWLWQTNRSIHQTDLGNAGSLRYVLQTAMQLPPDEVLYFCEDDYFHLPFAPRLIDEISSRTDYFTLYDHPDKYTENYEFGEVSKVIRTASSHWRFTQSTCMTFGCKVQTLQEDWAVWEKFTEGSHPHDHSIFTELGQKGRRLAVSIPGAACHIDLTFSNDKGENLLELWAIDLAIDAIEKKNGIYTSKPLGCGVRTSNRMELWNKLIFLNLTIGCKLS